MNSNPPTVFHITHHKAGSQWLHKIFLKCVPDLVVRPEVEVVQFLGRPIEPGKVYPTLYVTKAQFHSVRLPDEWKRFVIIRDLRDTMISGYFSMKISHPVLHQRINKVRNLLSQRDMDDGLLFFIDEWLPGVARVQKSWLDAGETLIRYEDLLENDVEILERVLLDEAQLPVERESFRQAVVENRFQQLTGGRRRGEEDINAHERKGVAGDWRNHFSPRIKQAFKAQYGRLLIETGYESDNNW